MSYHNEFILAGSSDSVHRRIRGRRRSTATDAVGRDDFERTEPAKLLLRPHRRPRKNSPPCPDVLLPSRLHFRLALVFASFAVNEG